jgi:ABC-type nitrate/sulfonate/bicarbonate transport system substrate-binding protein
MRSRIGLGGSTWLIALVVLLLAAACGGADGPDAGTESGGADPSGSEVPVSLGEVTILLPIDSPNMLGFKIADALGYYEQQGVDVTLQYVDGSGESAQQMLAGNGDVAVLGTGNVLDALEEGQDAIRVIGNVNYGSVFFLSVPEDSDIQDENDLEGRTVGISDLSGGEVPVVEGIIRSAGLEPGVDVDLLPIGAGTALAVRAIEEGQVDAFGGSANDIIAIEVQGLPLRRILPEILTTLPGLPVATRQDALDEKRDAIIAAMRAMTMGQEFAQTNPEAAQAVLSELNPEQFVDETGGLILEAILPLWQAPEGDLFGSQTVQQWEDFAEFVQSDLPEGADLSTVIVADIPDAANDYDHEALQAEAEGYSSD